MKQSTTLTLAGGSYLSPVTAGFAKGDVVCAGDTIRSTGQPAEGAGAVIDCTGRMILPGLVDIHTHGAVGIDCMTATPGEYRQWAQFLASHGVTTFLPTTISAPEQAVLHMLGNMAQAAADPDMPATIAGVHIEGPYINALHKGCHDESAIVPPSIAQLNQIKAALSGGMKLRVTVAPEAEGGMDFIRAIVSSGGSVTIGHSDATVEVAKEAVANGANCFTHLFNGMRGIHHREPGTAGAALVTDAYAELICDGIHLHPDIIRLVLRAKGVGRIITVTDAMLATGLGDGEYSFGGLPVRVTEGTARNGEGALAGSTLTLDRAVRNFAGFTGLPLEQAALAATVNPARAVGLDALIGTVDAGKLADLIVVDDHFNVLHTISRGRLVYSKNA